MKMIFTIVLGLFASMTGALSVSAETKAKTPMQLLQETQKKVEKIINVKLKPTDSKAKNKREKDVQKLVEPFFAFELLAKRTLGKHWKTLKPAQRKRFTFWFKELLKQAYIGGTRVGEKKRTQQKHTLEYKREKIKGNNAKVFTLIKYQVIRRKRKRWKKVYVDWSFEKKKSGWKVTDIETNDNSLMDTYRENFDKIIRKKSFATLVKKIKKKVLQLRKKHGLSTLSMTAAKAKTATKPQKR